MILLLSLMIALVPLVAWLALLLLAHLELRASRCRRVHSGRVGSHGLAQGLQAQRDEQLRYLQLGRLSMIWATGERVQPREAVPTSMLIPDRAGPVAATSMKDEGHD